MTTPVVGQLVHYYSASQDGVLHVPDSKNDVLAAIITRVYPEGEESARYVDLAIFAQSGSVQGRASVALVQDGKPEVGPESAWCEYPQETSWLKRTLGTDHSADPEPTSEVHKTSHKRKY